MATDRRGRKLPKGIRRRGDSFEGRFQYQGESYQVQGATVTETQKAMNDLKYRVEHGLFVEREKILFSDWFHTWMEQYKKNRVKAGTYRNYFAWYDAMLADKLGDKKISDIRGEHIQRLYNELEKEGYALPSIRGAAAVLSGCMRQALRNGLIERNPVKLAELPRQEKKEARQAMTKEQQALFMEYAKDSYLYNLYAVMLRTGLRGGEIRGLKCSDIDKKKKVIHVQRTILYVPGKGYVEDTPKTRTSRRDIPLTADLRALLEAQRNFWGFKVERLDRYLFCNEQGKFLSPKCLQAETDRIVKRIQADGHKFERITPHVFRHTFATRAIEAGMPPQVLKAILGHSSLAMTMDLYSHVMPDTKAEEMEKIAGAF